MSAARLPPKLAQPPTLRHSGKWLHWATYGWSTPNRARRWRTENCAPACELHDAGPSGVQFKLSRSLPIFKLQFPKSRMPQWKCQTGRNTDGHSRNGRN